MRSPNCDTRPPQVAVDLLVIHNISLPPGEFGGDYIEALFTNQLDCKAHPYFAQLEGLRTHKVGVGRDEVTDQRVEVGLHRAELLTVREEVVHG